jgi:exopolyphosphatase/guanosine-5'-triphosphate,3'-diphosphate pyrophosphatase
MKYGVIDIGSNSVRLMMSDGINTLYKNVKTTRLAEGMGEDLLLKDEPIERTARAVSFFVEKAKIENADEIFVFATAAVRRSKNKQQFIDLIKNLCNADVDVVSGEDEARLGVLGALNGADGGVIDVGGASAEICVVKDGARVYTKSLYLGAVSVTDKCGQNRNTVDKFVAEKVEEYGNVPKTEFYAVGGTATSIAALILELDPYDPERVDGYTVTFDQMEKLCSRLFAMSVSEREKLKGLQKERAKVIASGVAIVLSIMKKLGINKLTVSEKDNLEGYLKVKMEKK